jgi:hypothetical protein
MANQTSKTPAKVAKKAAPNRLAAKPTLLAGGNLRSRRPTATPPCRPTSRACRAGNTTSGGRLDALIVRTVPDVRKAVKWNSPFHGIEGQSWFLNFHCLTMYDIHEDDQLDEEQMATWIRQAASLPGWVP